MKYYSLTTLFALTVLTLGLTGCKDYTYTLNQQPIFTSPELFSSYDISDSSLKSCTEQAIFDQTVTRANQLTHLNCSNAGISELKGLEIFTSLTHINLSGNKLVQVKPLLFLSQLQMVALETNKHLDCSDGRQLANQVNGSVKLPVHCSR